MPRPNPGSRRLVPTPADRKSCREFRRARPDRYPRTEIEATNRWRCVPTLTLLTARVRQDEPRRLYVASRQRLNGVAAEVQHGLDDVVGVDRERRQTGVIVAVDGDAFGRFAAQQVIDALQQFVHVDELLSGRGGCVRDPACGVLEKIGEPVRLADDDSRVLRAAQGSNSSRSSSCAAPRKPPKGFLISCASTADHQSAAAQLRQQRILASQALVMRDVLDLRAASGSGVLPQRYLASRRSRGECDRLLPCAGQASSLRCTTPSPPWRARSKSGIKLSEPRVRSVMLRPSA